VLVQGFVVPFPEHFAVARLFHSERTSARSAERMSVSPSMASSPSAATPTLVVIQRPTPPPGSGIAHMMVDSIGG
jgi:hypothetical protein